MLDVKVTGYPLSACIDRGVEWGGGEPDGTRAIIFDDNYDLAMFSLHDGVLVAGPRIVEPATTEK